MISKTYLSLAVVLIVIGCILNTATGESSRDSSFVDGPSSKAVEEQQDLLLINKLKQITNFYKIKVFLCVRFNPSEIT